MSRTKTRKCKECSELFEAEIRAINRGNGKFCSQSCANSYINRNRTGSSKEVECDFCGKRFKKAKSKVKDFNFCCREHKDKAQRLDFGIEAIQPDHYGTSNRNYRQRKLREVEEPQCSECQKTLPKPVLQVHHIDGDRENNNLDNLEILCPTCHELKHFQEGTGKWGQS